MAFISISIDLAGSTNLKKEITEISRDDPENIEYLYQKMGERIYLTEMGFYSQALNYGLDITRFFVIKTIGDEIWIAYDLKDVELRTSEFNSICHGLLESLLTVASGSGPFIITSRKMSAEEENNPGLQSPSGVDVSSHPFAFKIYIDIAESFREISSVRYDTLLDNYRSLFSSRIEFQDLDYPAKKNLINCLNIGAVTDKPGGKIDVTFRFDPFGFEIDRFFRCTKAAMPGIVTCGSALVDKLYESALWIRDYDHLTENCSLPYVDSKVTRYGHYDIIWHQIPKEELKGIGSVYDVCHILSRPISLDPALCIDFVNGATHSSMFRSTIELLDGQGLLKRPKGSVNGGDGIES